MKRFYPSQGFTLAELLIALAILGVIATFTIPKVLFTANSGQNTAVAKEAASMISGAYTAYALENGSAASGTTAGVLTPYMNYVAVDNTATAYSFGAGCNAANTVCLKLHNGGVLRYASNNSFGGTATTNAIYFNIDPDGTGSATPATFVLYFNGRLTTAANQDGSTATANAPTTYTPDPAYIANWN